MARRQFSNTATTATLTGGVAAADTSFTLTSFAGYPATPFTATISRGELDEEIVLITAVSSSTVTATRGYDGTSPKSHAAGASFVHTTIAKDFDEANAHVNQTTGVHGLASGPVGVSDTQTLSNKTLTAPVLATPTLTGAASGASLALSGTLSVTGSTTLGALAVNGAATVTGALTATGTVSGATPTTSGHLTTKAYVDAIGTRVTTAEGTLAAATPTSGNNTLVQRSSTGTYEAATPTAAAQVATKGYVDGQVATLPKIQRGNTGTITFSGDTFQSGTVTFPTAFSGTPTVLLSMQVPGTTDFVAVLTGAPSTTGFSWRVRERGGVAATGTTLLHWVAIG